MTPLDQAVFPLRQRMLDDMRMRKLAGKTQAAYVRALYRLVAFLDRSPDTASAEDLRRVSDRHIPASRGSAYIGHPSRQAPPVRIGM